MLRGKNIAVAWSLALALVGVASAATFGSWSSDIADDRSYVYAATGNDSGNILGEYCYPEKGSCIWILGMATSCEEGHTYPVLANADTAAAQLDVVCRGPLANHLYSYAFTNFDDIDHLVKAGSKVGFAVPLQADQFRVVRFLLNGATSAITNMRSAATQMNTGHVKGKTGTRDQDI